MLHSKKLLLLLLLATSACASPDPSSAPFKGLILKNPEARTPTQPIVAPSQEAALVRGLLVDLQRASIAQNIEFCGFVGLDRAGQLVLSNPVRGDEASCLPVAPRHIQTITASYHTHGGFSSDYLGELPSPGDVAGDQEMGVNGYVSTPGGRFWFIDSRSGQLTQICGFGCLPSDPRFQRGGDGPIAQSYSFAALSQRHGN